MAVLADAWQDVQVPSSAADYRLRLRTSRTSDEWRYATATTKPPKVRGDAFVTPRVTDRDGDGNEVRQTVTRGYLHRG
ncbi:hypothetical protein HFP71_37625 [Streptomyces sp. ARC32]